MPVRCRDIVLDAIQIKYEIHKQLDKINEPLQTSNPKRKMDDFYASLIHITRYQYQRETQDSKRASMRCYTVHYFYDTN